MLNKNKIAVTSSGNGGQTMAAYFAQLGYSVSLYVHEKERADMFPDDHLFHLKGLIEADAVVDCISNDMCEVVRDAHLVMVTTPAQYHPDIAKAMSPCLEDGQIVLLNPGRTFGTAVFHKVLKDNDNNKKIILAEAETFIFACRCTRIAEPIIHGLKNVMYVAAHDARDTEKVVATLDPLFPSEIRGAKSTLHTSFSNIGVVFHPLPILLNITKVEHKEKFRFYIDGITPLVANIIERMDRERIAVAKAYGIEVESAFDWLHHHYHSEGDNLYERIQNTEAYQNIYAPTDIDTRYVYEDVKTGCVPLYFAGKEAGVETPIIQSVIQWASTIYSTDFMQHGRNDQVIDYPQLYNQSRPEIQNPLSLFPEASA